MVVHSSPIIMFQGKKLDRQMSSWDSLIWRCLCMIELGTEFFWNLTSFPDVVIIKNILQFNSKYEVASAYVVAAHYYKKTSTTGMHQFLLSYTIILVNAWMNCKYNSCHCKYNSCHWSVKWWSISPFQFSQLHFILIRGKMWIHWSLIDVFMFCFSHCE